MKHFFLIALLSVVAFGDPVRLTDPGKLTQEPIIARLSDGRIVPLGPGVICAEECAEEEVFQADMDSRRMRVGIVLGIGLAVGTVWLFRGRERLPPASSVPGVPIASLPERGTLGMIFVGYFIFSLRKGFYGRT